MSEWEKREGKRLQGRYKCGIDVSKKLVPYKKILSVGKCKLKQTLRLTCYLYLKNI